MNDCVFTSSYGGKSLLLEFEPNAGWKVNARWENKREGYMSSPIIIGDYIYLHLRNKRFTCLELAHVAANAGQHIPLVNTGA